MSRRPATTGLAKGPDGVHAGERPLLAGGPQRCTLYNVTEHARPLSFFQDVLRNAVGNAVWWIVALVGGGVWVGFSRAAFFVLKYQEALLLGFLGLFLTGWVLSRAVGSARPRGQPLGPQREKEASRPALGLTEAQTLLLQFLASKRNPCEGLDTLRREAAQLGLSVLDFNVALGTLEEMGLLTTWLDRDVSVVELLPKGASALS